MNAGEPNDEAVPRDDESRGCRFVARGAWPWQLRVRVVETFVRVSAV